MIAIRTDGPTHWSVYAPNAYDASVESRYFGPDTLDACVEAARVLHSMMPPDDDAPEMVTRWCVSCDTEIHVHRDADAAWGEMRCEDCKPTTVKRSRVWTA